MKQMLSLGACLLLFLGVWAQQRTIRGKVTDGNGKPLQGVNIQVKGTTNATQTDCFPGRRRPLWRWRQSLFS